MFMLSFGGWGGCRGIVLLYLQIGEAGEGGGEGWYWEEI